MYIFSNFLSFICVLRQLLQKVTKDYSRFPSKFLYLPYFFSHRWQIVFHYFGFKLLFYTVFKSYSMNNLKHNNMIFLLILWYLFVIWKAQGTFQRVNKFSHENHQILQGRVCISFVRKATGSWPVVEGSSDQDRRPDYLLKREWRSFSFLVSQQFPVNISSKT